MYDFKTFQFGSGAHATREDGMCVMEAVAYVAGEAHTDRPKCASPIIAAFCRSWNDGLESDAERNKWLSEFVWRLPGTASTEAIELQRSWMAFDWLVRECLPAFLELTPSLQSNAADLRDLDEINASNFDLVVPIVNAAWAAAGAAAWAAAGAAAGDAAGAAAGDALRPTVESLKPSARDLLDRMVRLTEVREPCFDQPALTHELSV